MRIAFLAAEMSPFAQIGGLGDVARWLPATLAAGGDEVAAFLPHYDVLRPGDLEIRRIAEAIPVPGIGEVGLSTLGPVGPGRATVYLVDAPDWFLRGAVYPSHGDDHLRYAVFAAGVIAACKEMAWEPDVFHANDFHTALLPLHAGTAGEPWASIPVVLTIHNLAFQGHFPLADLPDMGLGPVADRISRTEPGLGNALGTGIVAADLLTTVSPTYAREILGAEQGMGLDGLLRSRRDDLVGILNGVGDEWDPATDQWIVSNFDLGSMAGKVENRASLRAELGLADDPVPLLGVVSRLTEQKGFDLFPEAVVPLLEAGRVQLAVVGTGQAHFVEFFVSLASEFTGRAGYRRDFDVGLGHRVEAGSDMFLMPSRFEPCGLNQMYSMRYGTIPVVRRTGGLADTVEHWDPAAGTGTGFLFDDYSGPAFAGALEEALSAFEDRDGWQGLMSNAMAMDWSWNRQADEYRIVYERAIARRLRSG